MVVLMCWFTSLILSSNDYYFQNGIWYCRHAHPWCQILGLMASNNWHSCALHHWYRSTVKVRSAVIYFSCCLGVQCWMRSFKKNSKTPSRWKWTVKSIQQVKGADLGSIFQGKLHTTCKFEAPTKLCWLYCSKGSKIGTEMCQCIVVMLCRFMVCFHQPGHPFALRIGKTQLIIMSANICFVTGSNFISMMLVDILNFFVLLFGVRIQIPKLKFYHQTHTPFFHQNTDKL